MKHHDRPCDRVRYLLSRDADGVNKERASRAARDHAAGCDPCRGAVKGFIRVHLVSRSPRHDVERPRRFGGVADRVAVSVQGGLLDATRALLACRLLSLLGEARPRREDWLFDLAADLIVELRGMREPIDVDLARCVRVLADCDGDDDDLRRGYERARTLLACDPPAPRLHRGVVRGAARDRAADWATGVLVETTGRAGDL